MSSMFLFSFRTVYTGTRSSHCQRYIGIYGKFKEAHDEGSGLCKPDNKASVDGKRKCHVTFDCKSNENTAVMNFLKDKLDELANSDFAKTEYEPCPDSAACIASRGGFPSPDCKQTWRKIPKGLEL